jgi:hypothetical protein
MFEDSYAWGFTVLMGVVLGFVWGELLEQDFMTRAYKYQVERLTNALVRNCRDITDLMSKANNLPGVVAALAERGRLYRRDKEVWDGEVQWYRSNWIDADQEVKSLRRKLREERTKKVRSTLIVRTTSPKG